MPKKLRKVNFGLAQSRLKLGLGLRLASTRCIKNFTYICLNLQPSLIQCN